MVIPSLGAATLEACLAALREQTRPPDHILIVLSGGARPDPDAPGTVILEDRRLGFAAAVNRGFRSVPPDTTLLALLNDDALPGACWLERLTEELRSREKTLAAVQGTVLTTQDPPTIDGRGIGLDRFGLPFQIDRDGPDREPSSDPRPVFGVSATAALFRLSALRRAALDGSMLLDERFDSYHEDTDLALRFTRLGLRSAWVSGAPCTHVGSVTGRRRAWRHPWWILSNRWRALCGNLTPWAFAMAVPRLLRGELRAVRTLARDNRRSWIVEAGVLAALPMIKIQGFLRSSPGPRLRRLPGGGP